MKRDIIFRGKRVDNGKWVYGYLIDNIYGGQPIIVYSSELNDGNNVEIDYEHVLPETIGQYTDMDDKNGTKIFEGDIITTSTGRKCLVKWFHSSQYCGWDLKPIEWENPEPARWDLYMSSNLEVISNIYDNPELLEATK